MARHILLFTRFTLCMFSLEIANLLRTSFVFVFFSRPETSLAIYALMYLLSK